MSDRMTTLVRSAAASAGAVILLASAPGAAHAQDQADARWLPWLGCWEAVGMPAGNDSAGDFVCVDRAADARGVEIRTISDGAVSATQTLVADGTRRPVDREGCTGWESAGWSEDGHRVYVRSDLNCGPNLHRLSSGTLSITSENEWLDVQAVGAEGQKLTRTARYTLASPERVRAAGITTGAVAGGLALSTARAAAATPLDVDAIIDASRHVDAEVVQALVAEEQPELDLDSHRIRALADAGVSTDVIDMMVAVSYPDVFTINTETAMGNFRPDEPGDRNAREDDYGGRRVYGTFGYDPFGWGYYSPYSRYGYNSFYSPYGYGYNPSFGYGVGSPIIIVRDDEDSRPQGRVVKGRGYTRSGSTSSGTESSRTPRASTSSTSTGSGTGSAVTSSGSSTGSSSSSTGRTAKKRGGG
jgi:hypothetical protein